MKKVFSLILTALLIITCFSACTSTNVSYVVLDESLANEQYAIGFRKTDQTLRDEVQKILCEMKNDGKAAEISKTWFGKDYITIPSTFTKTESSDTSLADIKAKGKLVLGLDDSFPPMGFNKDGKIVGFDIDLAKEVCSRMGVELELVPIIWDNKELELNDKNIDCIWNGLSVNDEREAAMNLSEPYMNNRQVVVTLDNSGIKTLADLNGKTVVLQSGSTAVEALDNNTTVKSTLKDSIEVENNILALYELKQKSSDAVIMDEVVARYYISHLNELEAEASAAESK